MQYWIIKNGKKYCLAESKEQAENIREAIINAENAKQNNRNCFVNLSVEIRKIRTCADCVHYQDCLFSKNVCKSYQDAPKVIDSFC